LVLCLFVLYLLPMYSLVRDCYLLLVLCLFVLYLLSMYSLVRASFLNFALLVAMWSTFLL